MLLFRPAAAAAAALSLEKVIVGKMGKNTAIDRLIPIPKLRLSKTTSAQRT